MKMRNTIFISLALSICAVLTGCSCEHTYDNGSVTKAATCTEAGILTYTCQECKETTTEELPLVEHTYDAGSVTLEASCLNPGIMTYTCQNCAYIMTEVIPASEHVYSAETVKEASYSEEGVVKYSCSGCSDTYTDTIPVKEAEAVVSVTEKESIPEDHGAWRFSDYVRLSIQIDNLSNRSIKGIQGILVVKDMFGEEFLRINCDLTDKDIPANGSITITDLYMDINQFFANHLKLFNTAYEDLQFEYIIKNILFTD